GCIPTFFDRYGPDDQVIPLLPYYDAANFLKLTKAKLLVEAGLVDFTCPAKCVIGGFNSAVSKDKVLLTSPFRPHGSTAALSEYQLEEWRRTVNSVRNELMKDYLAPAKAN
ncbi:MAG: acetylxylan esterase, partial [Bacteroidales bacterium]|nr:acetylxylan esterase [Bacteroidales bacterium]